MLEIFNLKNMRIRCVDDFGHDNLQINLLYRFLIKFYEYYFKLVIYELYGRLASFFFFKFI